jgi:hypothetical protein
VPLHRPGRDSPLHVLQPWFYTCCRFENLWVIMWTRWPSAFWKGSNEKGRGSPKREAHTGQANTAPPPIHLLWKCYQCSQKRRDTLKSLVHDLWRSLCSCSLLTLKSLLLF